MNKKPWLGGWATKGMTLAQKLDYFTDKTGGPDACWLWKASHNGVGYGTVCWQKKYQLAHRATWEQHHGAIPLGMYLCHKCDNPLCVNPAHMFVGTPRDNSRDMVEKMRGCHGARQGAAKLTDAKVRAIRADTRSQDVIAAEYGISQSNVSHIQRGNTWTHLGGAIRRREDGVICSSRRKLTDDHVLAIRKDTRSNTVIAAELGVDPSCISRVKARRAYARLPDAPS